MSQISDLVDDLGVDTGDWKYKAGGDCKYCDGMGFHYALRGETEFVVACDECYPGKNLQKAPKPNISHTLKEIAGAIYSRSTNSKFRKVE